MSVRGFAAGSLALIALETLVQQGASDKAGGLLTKSSELLEHVLSATTPGLHWYAGRGVTTTAPPGLATPNTPTAVAVSTGPTNPTIDQFINGLTVTQAI